MMKMINASTREIDDPEEALREILGQLDLKKRLLQNAVGLIACHADYLESGVVKALCEALPFDVAGCTTLSSSVNGQYGIELLSLSVLTSDEERFSTAFSAGISAGGVEAVQALYRSVGAEKTALVLAYAPMYSAMGGPAILEALDRASGGAPVFGGLTCCHASSPAESHVIYNGEASKDGLALVLIHGNIKPRFFITAIPENQIQKQAAIITESEGCMVKKVNNTTPLEYFDSLGLITGGKISSNKIMPLIVKYNDGTEAVVRGLYNLTPEGYMFCGGEMPEQATFAVGILDYNGVIETAESTVSRALEAVPGGSLLMFPCFSRGMVMGPNVDDEVKKVVSLVGGKIPYHFCYTGGEICPVSNEEGAFLNRFHNFTFTICAL
ncbi:MAG: FIST C-terminal domain-containing protein [Treponema sp.]|jgi:hypothetical protein|nr:FIST C-terminal domain-containing protein [Treponema sp.]